MAESQVKITCSPGTLSRIQQDPEFLKELLQSSSEAETTASEEQFLQTEDAFFESIIEEEYPDNKQADSKIIWIDAAVKLLLSLVSSLRPKVGKSLALKNKKKMWEAISERLREKGYNFSAAQAENKYRGLEKTYKRTKAHNKKTGRNRESFPYEKQLDDLLLNRDSVFAVYVLGSQKENVATRETLIAAAGGGTIENSESDSLPNPPATVNVMESSSSRALKKNKQEEILEELKGMRQERKLFHAEVLSNLKAKNAISKEKTEILKSILNAINK